MNSANLYGGGDGGVCVCAHACVCASTLACVRAGCVCYIYDNKILPRLIMIIIKIIFLYFIQIRHTDDSPHRVRYFDIAAGQSFDKHNEMQNELHTGHELHRRHNLWCFLFDVTLDTCSGRGHQI